MLNIYDIIFVISYTTIKTLLYSITYKWIEHMEKTGCKCSEDWKEQFIKYFIMFIIPYNIISALYLIFIGENMIIAFTIKIIILVLTILFIILTFLYIIKLKKEKCDCSEGIEREITLIYTIIQGCLIFISISIIIFINFSLYIASNKYSSNTIS